MPRVNSGATVTTNTSLFSYQVLNVPASAGGSGGSYSATTLDWCDIEQSEAHPFTASMVTRSPRPVSISSSLISQMTVAEAKIKCQAPWSATLLGSYTYSYNPTARFSALGGSKIRVNAGRPILYSLDTTLNRVFWAVDRIAGDLSGRIYQVKNKGWPKDEEWAAIYNVTTMCPPQLARQ